MDTLYNNMKAETDDLKKCYDPKESEKYSNETTNWLGSSSLTAARFYKQFIRVANQVPFRVLEFLTSSTDGEQFMNAIIRFIDDTVITPAEDRWISSFD
ncbi:Influenza virus NS1A-binding [Gossypium arboreum]|uniref:Influenza virus NS1A-binding n=1 Tax=Gossypium arboreum TaxID=29729 RepID=A0A0B0PC86_GOSAR|nr:Influenza virus NS1A-binding [Gossypium arboreum]